MKKLFPSPLGDEVLKPWDFVVLNRQIAEFPSPLGDEVLKPRKRRRVRQPRKLFPSPLGDEVLKPWEWNSVNSGFVRFPSPLGDEVLKPRRNPCGTLFYSERFRPLSGMRYLNQGLHS